MRAPFIIGFLVIILLLDVAESLKLAEPCDASQCKLPNCKCSTTDSGSSIPIGKIPQIVMPSFDDAVNSITYDAFAKTLFNRKNPDGCPIGVTHFLSHEWTDYSLVHDLWLKGHEIALHSVSHNSADSYWAKINVTRFKSEFGDMRTIANHFALIPMNEMRGMRLPLLSTSGDVSFQGLEELGLSYDSSLPARLNVNSTLWPYTLEYRSQQDCVIEPCPTASFPNVWEVPMIMWADKNNLICSMVDACSDTPGDVESITEWMIKQFDRHYKGNRAPFPIFMHAVWLIRNPQNLKAYAKFMDHLQTLPDVYILTVNKTIEWIKNPKSLDDEMPFGPCTVNTSPGTCRPRGCTVRAWAREERWFTSCQACPKKYPWLGNPLGD